MRRYRTLIADSARWSGLELRSGDIIICTPPKSGTTWTQMLCALLVFDGDEFPAPLERLSPWVDMLNRSAAEVYDTYASQQHRRFLKTHTPLDGLPWRDDVSYVVVGRDPRDVAVSMEHHRANMDLDRFMELRAEAVGLDDLDDLPPRPAPDPDPAERFRAFVEVEDLGGPPTLHGVVAHLGQAWAIRARPNVTLLHYSDLRADLPGELHRLGMRLGHDLTRDRAEELAASATLDAMRARADDVVPSASLGTFRSTAAFLRAGSTGEWRDRVTASDIERYDQRVSELAEPDLADWLHRGRLASGITPETHP